MKRTLVLYHFYEKNAIYIKNLAHFSIFGIMSNADYVFIVAGSTTVSFPDLPNVKVYHTENFNSDYGGYSWFIKNFSIEEYENIIFINSSVRGPYLTGNEKVNWVDIFTSPLDNECSLMGSSINILPVESVYTKLYMEVFDEKPPFSHVQTMAYAMKAQTVSFLKEKNFFSGIERYTKDQAIINYEIRLSQLILNAGGSIRCLLPEYNDIDYAQPHQDVNPTSVNGDPNYTNAYFGRTIHPYEAIFVKTNRDIIPENYLNRLAFRMLHSKSIFVSCKLNPTIESYLGELSKIPSDKQI